MSTRVESESRITVKTKTGGNQSTNISIPSLRIIYTPARPLHLSSVVHKIENPYIHMLEIKSYIRLTNLQPYQRHSTATADRERASTKGLMVIIVIKLK